MMRKARTPRNMYQAPAKGIFNICAGLTILAMATIGILAGQSKHASGKRGRGKVTNYQQSNLVSDVENVALLQDTNLVNAWGISFGPASPFWVSDNGTGLSTLYAVTNDASGYHVTKVGLEVTIPGEGNPTGQTFNNSGAFNGDVFIFASEDGTISGWRGALGTAAEVLATRSNAVYKGITLSSNASGHILLAANFAEGTIDVYGSTGSNALLITQFSDPKTPSGYAPFNVQSLGGIVVVTFAKQDAEKHDDAPGAGHGFIDIFNPNTGKFKRFATGSDAGGHLSEIDSPWGLAVSPASFGTHGDELLVGNFGSGTIMAFESDGAFRGLLQDASHEALTIEGLWALTFGNGNLAGSKDTLFFSAGPGGESHGLFGAIDPLPGKKKHRHGHDKDDNDDDED